jgi:hypothetical protein
MVEGVETNLGTKLSERSFVAAMPQHCADTASSSDLHVW